MPLTIIIYPFPSGHVTVSPGCEIYVIVSFSTTIFTRPPIRLSISAVLGAAEELKYIG